MVTLLSNLVNQNVSAIKHDPKAVDDDCSRNGQQDKGQDAERGGCVSRNVDAYHDQDNREHKIPDPPDGDARECDQEHAVDRLQEGVIHGAIADTLVELFGVGPDERHHQRVDEAEDAQQGDQFTEAPAAEGVVLLKMMFRLSNSQPSHIRLSRMLTTVSARYASAI